MEGGERNPDDDVAEAMYAGVGAYVMGRRMFDVGEEPWGDEPPFRAPVFVVTHRPRDVLERKGGTSFTFVTDGLESAIDRARQAAGDADVTLSGGPDLVRRALAAGLVDELHLHVSPVLLGGGMRLFDRLDGAPIELERVDLVDSPGVTHVRYRPSR
jgi:dihydrofolate reductase